MSRGRDDDPLAWGGDDDPTLEVGAKPAAREPVVEPAAQPEATEPDTVETTDAETKALPDGFTAVGKGSDEVRLSKSCRNLLPKPFGPPRNAFI